MGLYGSLEERVWELKLGKYSNFERRPRDLYTTPLEPVKPLIDHLPYTFDYVEPCAGDGRLINNITELTGGHGNCIFASDIEPLAEGMFKNDALTLDFGGYGTVDMCITNPPWSRDFLHPFIEHWLDICPTWLLFDSNWKETKQSAVLMTYCAKVISVGRVKWVEGSKGVGKEDCSWYLFDAYKTHQTYFYGRAV